MAKNTTAPKFAPKAATTVKEPDNAEILAAVKEAFNAVNDRDINLSDTVLAGVIERAKNWDDMDDDQKMAFLLQAEETANKVKVAITDPGITTLVGKMDDSFHKVVATHIDVIRKNKMSAVIFFAEFRRLYTLAEMNTMPMPGYDEKHAEGTGYRADKRSVKTPQGEPVTTVWTNDFVSAMPEGKAADTDLDNCKKWEGNIGPLKGKNSDEIAAIKSAATQDRNGLRSVVKRAIKLHHQMIAIGKLNAIGIRWISGDKSGVSMPTKYGLKEIGRDAEMVTRAPKPLWIYNVADPSKGKDFSVTQVLSFQPELARKGENGGNMADLIGTAGKGTDDADKGDGNKAGEDMADDEAQAIASMFVNFLTKTENRTAVLKKIADRKKDASGNDWLELVMELDRMVHPIAEKNRNNYLALQNAKIINQDDSAEAEAVA